MGKIADLFYKLTRGAEAPKPWENGPAVVLKDKCGCGKECGCNSVESLERSAGIEKKIKIEIVPATTDSKPSTIPADLKAHLEAEGKKPAPVRKSKVEKVIEESEHQPKQKVAPVIEGINKKATENKKKPVAKATEKKDAIAKDLADTPAPKKKPVAKKPAELKAPVAKKPTPKKK
jgi:hypothetical protein